MKATDRQTDKIFLSALNGEVTEKVPFWLMRQAGRYLPEYRELRAKAGGFLDMVYNPDFAAEVTLQPLRRYGMDAAILFSDILVIPHALGQKVEFLAGEGPKLDAVRVAPELERLEFNDAVLEPVYQAIGEIKSKLGKEGFNGTALIGFAGAPWTVATYMVEGGSSKNFEQVKKWAYGNEAGFTKLIDKITDATIIYLVRQIEAGAEALQLFDSWAGVLDEDQYDKWVISPAAKIFTAVRNKFPSVPLIGFPKGSGVLYKSYVAKTGAGALGLDASVPLDFAKELQQHLPVQGNLDPVCLLTGGDALKKKTEYILSGLSQGPFVFNLGHGVIKETPPEHVLMLSRIIQDFRR